MAAANRIGVSIGPIVLDDARTALARVRSLPGNQSDTAFEARRRVNSFAQPETDPDPNQLSKIVRQAR
jgi:hypothetical protein